MHEQPESISWILCVIVTLCMSVGFIIGAALFYPIGRRHGFKVALKHWEQMSSLTKSPKRRGPGC